MELENIKADLQSFSDDDAAVIVDRKGEILLFRNHNEIQAKVEIEQATGAVYIEHNGNLLPYKQFLSKSIARLDVFAEKIISKRKPKINDFIEGPGVLQSPLKSEAGGLIN